MVDPAGADSHATEAPHTRYVRCPTCGYSLWGLTEARCPECGQPFDLSDPSLYRRRRWQRFAKPPRWWHLAAISICTLAAIVDSARLPTFLGGMFLSCALVVVIPILLGDFLLRVGAVWHMRRMRRQMQARSLRWWATPACVLVLLSLWTPAPRWPLYLRFALSRSAFERAESACLKGNLAATGPQHIGLFKVKEISQVEPGVVYFRLGTDWMDTIGFVHRTSPPAPGHARQHFGHSWYLEWW